MSILHYNGGAIMAMKGKDCVGICSDLRLGIQTQTVATNFKKIFPITDRIMIGMAGLATDVLTLDQLLKFNCNMYKLRENRDMKPEAFAALVSTLLYEKRFSPWFIEPVIAGLSEDGVPFISGMDLIGAPEVPDSFITAGTCTPNLNGVCESFYEKDLEPEQLFQVMSQCLLAAVDRDALSGWGAEVHIITTEGVHTRQIKCRQD
mmetsp:Transcript_38664/g.39356  ORF Transcript_38664/g.39356 Transcript_38664/m.39356 type:complete len:205 (-) Transcript_38664:164-778(-)|eukprot:CAMPEP_0182424462 /NCGR_PEP_ID=MMETSP1167-20130531/10671_1 /TAXON_ID=2988 /ORGANISM="Mallomonas Sp, Strain CCMP3275" /LENGTH=204 /DNA_ID=CAMNT_0024604297 /DNA_START=127 /DNA_END=741 /DNA_ORIENTATION=-